MRNVPVALIACTSLFGCLDAATVPSESSTSQSVVVDNKIALNKIALNKIALNKIALNKIALNKIALNKIAANMLADDDLLATSDGRDVFSYVVGCALPASDTLEATVDGVVYDFPGAIGLAPAWEHRPLTASERGWISACMIARVNAHDVSVLISMRGPNDALAVTQQEAQDYTVEEGAFYGDIFTPDDDPLIVIACEGEGQASGEFGGLVDRDCTEPDPANPGLTQCGFTYAGHCADFSWHHPTPYACEDFSYAGYYRDCHDQAGWGFWPWWSDEYDQVITTFVTP